MLPPPSIAAETYTFSSSSTRYARQHLDATHVRVVASVNCWLRYGDSAVTVANNQSGAIYLPANSVIYAATRPTGPDTTHFAVKGASGSGFLNVTFLQEKESIEDLLENIYCVQMELLRTIRGGDTPVEVPYVPTGYKAHVDY